MSDAERPAKENRRSSLFWDVAGAALRGKRPGDDVIQKNLRSWLKLMGGGGLAIWIAVGAWSLGRRAIERSWDKSDAQIAALVTASENLTWSLWETDANLTNALAAMMKALKVQPPPVVHRPEKPEQKRPDPPRGDTRDWR